MIVKESDAIDNYCCLDRKETCRGSRCMAWRWVNPLDDEYTYLFDDAPDREKTYGFCGLAGRP